MPGPDQLSVFSAWNKIGQACEKHPVCLKTDCNLFVARDCLLQFTKNQRQIIPAGQIKFKMCKDARLNEAKLKEALIWIDKICGKCGDAHSPNCFVHVARRALTFALTGKDSTFTGH